MGDGIAWWDSASSGSRYTVHVLTVRLREKNGVPVELLYLSEECVYR
jgi:hypothetical protein